MVAKHDFSQLRPSLPFSIFLLVNVASGDCLKLVQSLDLRCFKLSEAVTSPVMYTMQEKLIKSDCSLTGLVRFICEIFIVLQMQFFPVGFANEKQVVANVIINTVVSNVKVTVHDRDGYAQQHREDE